MVLPDEGWSRFHNPTAMPSSTLTLDSRASAFPTTFSAEVNNKLRTLSLHREEEMVLKQQPCQITGIPTAMFANLTHLRILHLGATRIQQLPHIVGKLLNLRYFNLSQSQIQALPASLCNLRNLRVLNFAWCEKLRKLPERIHNLKSLQILKLPFVQGFRGYLNPSSVL
ncbi:resistance protein [Musa troglodytarum]|uniref:Resistance protein n=1 Tax=Musa troglodytarum TaxID=320322 RepID=A0A9E7HYL8_9LILI|nr:resistance protein [Musa troglodytarum]